MVDRRAHHKQLLKQLEAELAGNTKRIRVKKKSISNLWRYDGRKSTSERLVDLTEFAQSLYLDATKQNLEVQGLTRYEDIVDFTLPHGFLPTITPELKNITIGGATVGIGIEANCYRYGFVHDGLLEADVLLPDGRIVTCTPTNTYSDLFYGLPNSYGSLGYVLRAKIQLRKVTPYVQLRTEKFTDLNKFLHAMEQATKDPPLEYVESLSYAKDELYLILGKHVDTAQTLFSIYGETPFYKAVSRPGEITLRTKEYIFRFDADLFWGIPDTPAYKLFRRYAPHSMRNSGFYTLFDSWKRKLAKPFPFLLNDEKDLEYLIQDWEVPWRHGAALLTFAFENVDLDGKPWAITVIKTPAKATSYPMAKDKLYLNLGSYLFAKKKPGRPLYENTRIMDKFCFSHDGIKMLYSSTFLSDKEFSRIYGGETYAKLKAKYDPKELAPTLFEKTVKAY